MGSFRRYLSTIKQTLLRSIFQAKSYLIYAWQGESNVSFESFLEWNKLGRPIPLPHWIKQEIIKRLQERFHFRSFIETGTYLGDMVDAQRLHFEKLYSIELGHELYMNASRRFSAYPHVLLYCGDSQDLMPEIVAQLNGPSLFWLDGHYSGGITAKGKVTCPIYGELEAIFAGSKLNHVLVIDDERLFNGTDDYPVKLDLINFIRNKNPTCRVESKFDMIIVQLQW